MWYKKWKKVKNVLKLMFFERSENKGRWEESEFQTEQLIKWLNLPLLISLSF
jgi:hypothetical protein